MLIVVHVSRVGKSTITVHCTEKSYGYTFVHSTTQPSILESLKNKEGDGWRLESEYSNIRKASSTISGAEQGRGGTSSWSISIDQLLEQNGNGMHEGFENECTNVSHMIPCSVVQKMTIY